MDIIRYWALGGMDVAIVVGNVVAFAFSSYFIIDFMNSYKDDNGIEMINDYSNRISLIKRILYDNSQDDYFFVLVNIVVMLVTITYLLGFSGYKFVNSLINNKSNEKLFKKIILPGGDCGSDNFEWIPHFSDQSCTFDEKSNGKLVGNIRGRVTWTSKPLGNGSRKNYDKKFDLYINPNSSDALLRSRIEIQNKNSTTLNDFKKEFLTEKESSPSKQAASSAIIGSLYEATIQTEDGYWPADYGGPMFLLPGIVIASYITGVDLGKDRKKSMRDYLRNHQQVDGGWGTHIEGESTVFGTSLNYVTLRILGESATSKASTLARLWISSHGGVIGAPQWAKVWLSLLGVYDWNGVNPVPPELWMLPNWFPFHPGRFWCHCRMVYLPMSYLFGKRFVYPNAESDPLIYALRQELYSHARYEDIKWSSVRECIHPGDVYSPQTFTMTFGNALLNYTLENSIFRAIFYFPLNYFRRISIKFAADMVRAEDEHTNYIDIGPVSKALNLIVAYDAFGSESSYFLNHIPRIADYLWVSEDGMKMQGYNGSQLWDASFAAQGMLKAIDCTKDILSLGKMEEKINNTLYKCLEKTYSFVDEAQITEDLKDRELYYRDKTAGGWGFSTSANTWPVSDCTAEGFKAIVLIEDSNLVTFNENSTIKKIGDKRLQDAIDIILTMQNNDGGFPSYELSRGWNWFEILNPAQVFSDIMIDYSYVECTTASMTAMEKFAHRYPNDNRTLNLIPKSLMKGTDYILSKQRIDGSWYGSWGVCFTYAAMFAVEGLATGLFFFVSSENEPNNNYLTKSKKNSIFLSILKSIEFILSKQNEDGGWGESIRSCTDKVYVQNDREGSQIVQTSWALMSLIIAAETLSIAKCEGFNNLNIRNQTEKAAKYLISQQLEDGNWPQQSVAGVFNKSCSISYCNYRNSFPVWSLSKFALWHHKEFQ